MENRNQFIPGDDNGLWEKIREERHQTPSIFISGFEEDEDDQGIEPKNLSDPKEQFLTSAEEGDLKTLEKMYNECPEFLNAKDRDGYTALHRAAYNNRTEACKWLLAKGANHESRTGDGWTPLHCAACWANFEIIGILLGHGVDVNSRSAGDLTPLHLAVNSSADDPIRQYTTVKYLLEAPGILMSPVNKAGDTPIMIARRQSPEILELLKLHLK